MLQNQWKSIKHIKNIIPKPSNVTKPMEQHKKHKKLNSQTIKFYKTNGKALKTQFPNHAHMPRPEF